MHNYNVILIGVDTLRADHLGCYGYGRNTSPYINALAKKGVLFKNCLSQAPKTTPSFMSIMTSRYPTYHGITANISHMLRAGGRRICSLGPDVPTLAEILKGCGYQTAAFTDGGNLYSKIGFGRGFDYYAMNTKLLGIIPEDDILLWIRESAKKKFFLFFHTYAVHHPWVVPRRYLTLFDSEYRGKLRIRPSSSADPKRFPSRFYLRLADKNNPADIDYLRAIYDGAIKYVDDFIQNLLSLLIDLRIDNKTIIIFTSDHGEEFLDHGMLGHRQLYNELLHVPLIIGVPHLKNSSREQRTVRSMDIFPTILDLLDIKNSAPIHGISLFAARHTYPRLALAETEDVGYAIQDTKYKYIRPYYKKTRATQIGELYNLVRDPGEKNNIVSEHPHIIEKMCYRFKRELHHRIVLPRPRKKFISFPVSA